MFANCSATASFAITPCNLGLRFGLIVGFNEWGLFEGPRANGDEFGRIDFLPDAPDGVAKIIGDLLMKIFFLLKFAIIIMTHLHS